MYTETNIKILEMLRLLTPDIFELEPDLDSTLRHLIIAHPNKRFGWLVGTYICPDFNENNRDLLTDYILRCWYSDTDPLYEIPEDMVYRLGEKALPLHEDNIL